MVLDVILYVINSGMMPSCAFYYVECVSNSSSKVSVSVQQPGSY